MDIYDEGSFEGMLGTDYEDDIIKHYGTPRRSGRYPWGSGENPYQHEDWWLNEYRKYKDQGLSETEIAKKFNISTTILRDKRKAAQEADYVARVTYVRKMLAHGYTPTTLSKLTGWNESTIRGLRDAQLKEKESRSRGTADMLIREFNKKGWLDVGKGVDKEIGVTETTLKAALQILKEEGYTTVNVDIPQANNPEQHTTVKVLCKEGTTKGEVFKNIDKIQTVADYSPDFGKTYDKPEKPASIDAKRVYIRYGEEGGSAMDGTVEIRPGVKDLTLGKNHYAQVRIAVDGQSYMKGMAFYSNEVPEGYDVVYNTNKARGTDLYDGVFKPLKKNKMTKEIDWDNPFGAVIRNHGQNHYDDENGKSQLSPINIIKQEGDWDSYSKNIASQMLSKQKTEFVKRQLKLTLSEKMDEYNDILTIQNPTIKSKFLKDFAESCDKDAIELKATAVPGQSSKVILPVRSLKDNEVYAPTYKDGQILCLIRYPHGGVFEIPTLVVNNKNREAKKMMGNATDAIGINTHVAGVLSGADFDGDSVVVIPQSDKVKTLTKKPYKELEGWSEKMAELYAGYEGMPKMTDKEKQKQMGIVSNLITDMTIKGAPDDKIIRAVKHSMVVIDAQKHGYNYKQSEKDLGIAALKKEYQNGGGASTLISLAKNTVRVNKRTLGYRTDPETGEKIFIEDPKARYFKPIIDKKTGELLGYEERVKQQESTRMAEAKDAYTLSSGTMVENAYADYANSLKALANSARKQSIDIYKQKEKVDPELKKEFKEEIESLDRKVALAEANAPKERIAQVRANVFIREKIAQMPELADAEYSKDLKKFRQIGIADARSDVGASKKEVYVHLTDREKLAIERGAISSTKLQAIMKNMDKDELREYIMPKEFTTMPKSKIDRFKAMDNSGYTLKEISEATGVPVSTVAYWINGGDEKDK